MNLFNEQVHAQHCNMDRWQAPVSVPIDNAFTKASAEWDSFTVLKCACAHTAVYKVLKCACAHTAVCRVKGAAHEILIRVFMSCKFLVDNTERKTAYFAIFTVNP